MFVVIACTKAWLNSELIEYDSVVWFCMKWSVVIDLNEKLYELSGLECIDSVLIKLAAIRRERTCD